MKFTKKLVTVAAALCAVGALFLAGCGNNEDDLGIFNEKTGSTRTVDFTNDESVTGVKYARAFQTTKTKHLSADVLVEIDTKSTSQPKSGASYTVGYLFNLNGSGTADDPYSFGIVGLRYNYGGNNKVQYYISYFTNVLSDDVKYSASNFVTTGNNAIEYALTDKVDGSYGWVPLEDKYYYLNDDGLLTVCIKSEAVNDDGEKVTSGATGYKIKFAKSATEEDFVYTVDSVVNLTNLNNAAKAYKSEAAVKATEDSVKNIKLVGADKNETASYGRFYVEQAYLGWYVMIGNGVHLVCTMDMSDTVKSASTGDAVIWDEVITNVR